MSLGNFLYKQFIEVIQWTEGGPGVLAHRFPTNDLEIKNGASLTVRESQLAMFVNEGRVADVFQPGLYKLTTQTLPILTYLKNWAKGFESPFKSDIYFFSTRDQVGQLWGTATPITLRDKDFGMIRLRANGVYSYRIKNPDPFWHRLSATTPEYTVQDPDEQLRGLILTSIASFLGGSGVAFLDMASNQQAFSDKLRAAIAPAFEPYGLELTSFMVKSLSLPEELEQHIDKVSSMGMVGDIKRYTQFQAADSLSTAAANPGGVAGAGAGLGAGLALGQTMAAGLNLAGGGGAAAGPDPFTALQKLGDLLKAGVLTQAEFDAKKAELLQQIK